MQDQATERVVIIALITGALFVRKKEESMIIKIIIKIKNGGMLEA